MDRIEKYVISIYVAIVVVAVIVGIFCSCRSHKDTAVSESESVESSSAVQVHDLISKIGETSLNTSVSFDSIEIFIERSMGFGDSLHSEFIGIRAFNAKASSSSCTRDSADFYSDIQVLDYGHSESQREESVSSNYVSVFDPPKVLSVVVFSFIVAAIILCIVYFFKRR